MDADPSLPGADAALVAGLRAGDPAACEQFVRTCGGRMLATASRMLGNEEDARDVVQEAFLAAFQGIHAFAGQSQLTTWLHRILVNTALMKLRRKRSRPELAIEDLLPKFHEDGHHIDPPAPWSDGPEGTAEASERARLVRSAIDLLPETFRDVLVLRDLEGLSTEETARILGATSNAIKIRLHRARQALRTLLDRHFRENVR